MQAVSFIPYQRI